MTWRLVIKGASGSPPPAAPGLGEGPDNFLWNKVPPVNLEAENVQTTSHKTLEKQRQVPEHWRNTPHDQGLV